MLYIRDWWGIDRNTDIDTENLKRKANAVGD